MSKKNISTIGLVFITFLAAIQYIFLSTVPEDVSTFAFITVTNLVGGAILAVASFKALKKITRKTILKGFIFAIELLGMNFFAGVGARGMDSVIISSIMSMYFVFIPIILIMLRKKVNFFSTVASAIAIIALILMFNADLSALFSSTNTVYLIIADVFFAAYVVSVSLMGGNEDSTCLTLSQMFFATLLSLGGWGIEVLAGASSFTLPREIPFWVSVLFIGIFIRAVYGIIQIACQKYVPAINASLIFSSEIIITLMMDPIMCRLLHTEYKGTDVFQVVGCILFIIAALILDDTIMGKLGYVGMEDDEEDDGEERVAASAAADNIAAGGAIADIAATENVTSENATTDTVAVANADEKQDYPSEKSSMSRKMVVLTISLSMVILIASTIVCLFSIYVVKDTALNNSASLGNTAAYTSREALMAELEKELRFTAGDKAALAEAKLHTYMASVEYAVAYAEALLADPTGYPDKEISYPLKANGGIWAMQRVLKDESITYESVKAKNLLLGNMEDVFEPIVRNNTDISTIYMGIEDGLLVSYDTNSDLADYDHEAYYNFMEAEWYSTCKERDELFFTETYMDGVGRGLTITCVAPIHDVKGKFVGCLAIDILMNDLNDSMVNDGIEEPNRATLLSSDGHIIASRFDIGEDYSMESIYSSDIMNPIKSAAKLILDKKSGITSTNTDEGEYYVAYSEVPSTGWILCISSPVSETIKPAVIIADYIEDSTNVVVASVASGIYIVIKVCLVLSACALIITTLVVGRLTNKMISPLKHLTQDVKQISKGNFDIRAHIETNDEVGTLATSFNYMAQSLQQYISDLKEITIREERIASELNVARQIQESSLPIDFHDLPEYGLFAAMDPAKEVGGDFYDFFRIDDNHLGLVMADVSGKGVPASLFMMTSKTLIKNSCQTCQDPAKVLEQVNNQLCEGNEADMFVTVWLGILDITTGIMVASNAGHEYPAICRRDGEFELFKDKHGFVVAGMPGIQYTNYEITFEKGDRLFVYTDGVPEATNAQEVLFGTDRMLESLNKHKHCNNEEILHEMRKDIDEFVDEAPQFDDLTMLCFEYRGV